MDVALEFGLEDTTAVVTGGSRGIGRAISLGFAEAGANVVPLARDESTLEAAVAVPQGRPGGPGAGEGALQVDREHPL